MINIINKIRESFHGSDTVYGFGSCYKLYEILKEINPDAKALINSEGQHIISLIDGIAYDIHGVVEDISDFKELTKEQVSYFKNRVFNIHSPDFFVPEWVVDSDLEFLQSAQFALNCENGFKLVPIIDEIEYALIEKAVYSSQTDAYPPYHKYLDPDSYKSTHNKTYKMKKFVSIKNGKAYIGSEINFYLNDILYSNILVKNFIQNDNKILIQVSLNNEDFLIAPSLCFFK